MAAPHPTRWAILQAVLAVCESVPSVGRVEAVPKDTKSAAQFARLAMVGGIVDGLIIEFVAPGQKTTRFQDGRTSNTAFLLTRLRQVDSAAGSAAVALQAILESIGELEDAFALQANRRLGLSGDGVDVSHDLIQMPNGLGREQADLMDLFYAELELTVTARSC